jgi:hypothetical protein
MKIAFFTEMEFEGKVPREHINMRTEFAWFTALDAIHLPIKTMMAHGCAEYTGDNMFDIGIIIVPKKGIDKLIEWPVVPAMRNFCKKIAYMQEGPNWYFQDYPLEQQLWYYDTIRQMDAIFCHNEEDKKYYKGLFQKEHTYVMASLMIEDTIKPVLDHSGLGKQNVMIGGNFCSWYGGFDSYIVAKHFDMPISAPSMGRKIAREEEMDIKHLPYMNWTQWINELQNYKFGVHLMRTHAAGTFALNASYWGIPCIGYRGLDTQNILHPYTTVELGDIDEAVKIAERLKTDKEFYQNCSEITINQYKQFYSEDFFKRYTLQAIEKIVNSK